MKNKPQLAKVVAPVAQVAPAPVVEAPVAVAPQVAPAPVAPVEAPVVEPAVVDEPTANIKALSQTVDVVLASKTNAATLKKIALMLIDAKKKFTKKVDQDLLDDAVRKVYNKMLSMKNKAKK